MNKLLLVAAVLFLFSCSKSTQYTAIGTLGISTGINYHLKDATAGVLDTFMFNADNTITEIQAGKYHTIPVTYTATTQNSLPAVKITMNISGNIYLDSFHYFPYPPIVHTISDSVFIIKNVSTYSVIGSHINLTLVQY